MDCQAWRLKPEDAIWLGRVRHRPELEVCQADGSVWVRSASASDDLLTQLAGLPAVRFSVLADGQLVEWGRQVPRGYLPESPWSPLAQWMTVELPVPALAAAPRKVALQIVRHDVLEQPSILLAALADWHSYAVAAPQVRLDRLAFAVGDENRVVIRGQPLPPIKGVRFVERCGIAIQAGWTWQPAAAAEVLAAAIGMDGRELALFYADGRWDRVSESDFVQASRAAVRRSAEEVAGDR